jgi:hypothetical protein
LLADSETPTLRFFEIAPVFVPNHAAFRKRNYVGT